MSAKRTDPKNKKPASAIDAKAAKPAPSAKQATPSKNQRQAAQPRPASTTPIPYDTLTHRVTSRMTKFRGTGSAPKDGTDAYAGAAMAVYLLDRINLLLETKGPMQREVIPEYVKNFGSRYVKEMKALEPVGDLSFDSPPPIPGNFTPPELGVKESGDDTPPDILGWLLLAIARPKIDIVTAPSGTGNEDDDDDDDDSGSGRSGSGSGGTGSSSGSGSGSSSGSGSGSSSGRTDR
ncbi:MAG: hypothetical protein ACTS3F_09115 [Phycisphaerales bacterium]